MQVRNLFKVCIRLLRWEAVDFLGHEDAMREDLYEPFGSERQSLEKLKHLITGKIEELKPDMPPLKPGLASERVLRDFQDFPIIDKHLDGYLEIATQLAPKEDQGSSSRSQVEPCATAKTDSLDLGDTAMLDFEAAPSQVSSRTPTSGPRFWAQSSGSKVLGVKRTRRAPSSPVKTKEVASEYRVNARTRS